MTTLHLGKSIGWSPLRLAFLLIPLVLTCFALSPTAQAVCQQGCNTSLNNAFLGDEALSPTTTGDRNTAIGGQTLRDNTSGERNTATGVAALLLNQTGGSNTANGDSALVNNISGQENTAIGEAALFFSTSGFNTAIGAFALNNQTTGSNNIAVGWGSGLGLTTGSNNIYIGVGAGGDAGEADTIRIGAGQTATFIGGISGKTIPKGAPVFVNAFGQLGTVKSSARFKEAIKPMDKASEAILALKPVTFRYKQELDADKIPQFGLIAEEVEKVNPDLVVRDEDGKVSTVRYEAVNAMVLNEFLKAHKKVEELEATVASLAAAVKEQAAQIQKVSALLEVNKPAPQVVNNP